jgi:hypothetical protein
MPQPAGPEPLDKLREEAEISLKAEPAGVVGGSAWVQLKVRRGADLLTLGYYAESADSGRAGEAAIAVAREVLSKL